MKIPKYLNPSGPLTYNTPKDWASDWKFRLTPAAKSRVLSGKGVETDKQYTERRKKETTKRTWLSDAADIAHGVGEGVLSLHPYTAIPYFGAKVGQDFLNGTYGWHTALNASVPLFHLAPAPASVNTVINNTLEDAANAGSKTARNWRVAREVKQQVKSINPQLSNRTISVDRNINGFTGRPDLTYTLYNQFGEPIGLTNVGTANMGTIKRTGNRLLDRMVDGVYSKNKAHKVSEDTYNVAVQDILDNGGSGLESGWSLMSPLKTLAVTSKFPYSVIGQVPGNPVRLLTGRSSRPVPLRVLGNHFLELKPLTEIKFNEITGEFEEVPIKLKTQEPSTSLKFFERGPAKISEAERLGIPKGDRNLTTHGEAQAPYYNYSLLNRSYEPWRINEKGEFVFGPPEQSKKLATLHFSLNEPVISHIQGNWDDAPILTLLPYRNIRSHTAPVDVAIMDTFFPNYNGLKISSRGSKTLTGDRKTFEYYKENGVDVEFSPALESLRRKIRILDKRLERMPDSEKYSEFGHTALAKKMYDQRYELANKMDELMRDWASKHAERIPSYKKLNEFGKAEGFNTDKYPYSFGTPRVDMYGKPYGKYGLDYDWHSDPSNHANLIADPKGALNFALENDARPEYIKWLKWLIHNKADYRKQGGKMNAIEQFKNGYKIHIKKKNRGKFTSYCGGKVTSACILKAKASGNPTLVKRATFALNARTWKHLEGGNIWNTIDDYADKAEKALALGSIASMGATLAAPNPITLGTAVTTNIGSGIVDGYQGTRAALKGDWGNVFKNGFELLLSLLGAKALSSASKFSKLDDALKLSGSPRNYVTRTVGRRHKHKIKVTQEADNATTAYGVGYAAGLGANASSFGEIPTKKKKGGKIWLIPRSQ